MCKPDRRPPSRPPLGAPAPAPVPAAPASTTLRPPLPPSLPVPPIAAASTTTTSRPTESSSLPAALVASVAGSTTTVIRNAAGRPVHRGPNGAHYCGAQVGNSGYWTTCTRGCDGQCGPSNGCNCVPCHELDVELHLPGAEVSHKRRPTVGDLVRLEHSCLDKGVLQIGEEGIVEVYSGPGVASPFRVRSSVRGGSSWFTEAELVFLGPGPSAWRRINQNDFNSIVGSRVRLLQDGSVPFSMQDAENGPLGKRAMLIVGDVTRADSSDWTLRINDSWWYSFNDLEISTDSESGTPVSAPVANSSNQVRVICCIIGIRRKYVFRARCSSC